MERRISAANFLDWRAQARSFSDLAVWSSATFVITGIDQAAHIGGLLGGLALGAVVAAAGNFGFVWLAHQRVDEALLYVSTAADQFGNGFAGLDDPADRGVDGRFDLQVNQALPFMNFSNARWEMLLAVRNFFRDASSDQSLFDELLVVRPPTRVVGGVTLHF